MYRELMSTSESFGDESASLHSQLQFSYFEIKAGALSNTGLLTDDVRVKLILRSLRKV